MACCLVSTPTPTPVHPHITPTSFYESGYADGFAHGRIHGLIEGRALGRQHGFEMWEEVGFYEGFALTWRAILVRQGREDDRASQHIRHLLDCISYFPRANPSATDASSELDVAKLLRQIRSRYKMLCISLGVRPRLLAVSDAVASSAASPSSFASANDNENRNATDSSMLDEEKDGEGRRPGSTSSERVAPGSAIPVWKIDNAGLKKPVTNQDLDF